MTDDIFTRQNAKRCPWAIEFGTLATRCQYDLDHDGEHMGLGLPQFPYQKVEWFPGDRREFRTERRDHFSWELAPNDGSQA